MAPEEHGYRPALDGIWAMTVLAVFGYHLGYRWLRGGFLGVDVFFVLSGYLITGLLLTEHQRTGRISLTRFWLRRARRLLPALFLMILAVALWLHFNAAEITSKGARLVFVELPPTLPAACLNKDKQLRLDCRTPAANDVVQIPYNDVFRRLAMRLPHVSTISVTYVMCPNGMCSAELYGILLRYDGIHFSPAGSEWLAPFLYQRLIHAGVISR